MSYLTTSDIETFLNVTLTGNGQALVEALLPAVSSYADSFCNRSWNLSGTQTETFDGGQTTYFVATPPIAAVSAVVVDGQTLVAGTDYYVYGSYVRLASPAARGYRSVVISYTTPNNNLPADLKHALVRWVAEIFQSAEDGGKTVKRAQFGNQVETEFLVQDGVPRYVEMVLKRYRLSPI